MREKGKHEQPSETGAYLRKTVHTLLPALLISLAALSAAVYAAFISNGSAKGVLVHRNLNFNSNILYEYIASPTEIRCDAFESETVYIRNYNLNTREMNRFDITYTVTCRLENPHVTDGYLIVHGDQQWLLGTATNIDAPVNIVEPDGQISFQVTLMGDTQDEDSFTVTFYTGGETSQTAVVIDAAPSSPLFMRSHRLGAAIAKDSNTFFLGGGFVELDSAATRTDTLAGFRYCVSCTGVAEANQYIRLSWNSVYLELDPFSVLAKEGITVHDDGGRKYVEIDPEGSYEHFNSRFFYVSFYRTDAWPADATAAMLRESYVTREMVAAP